MDTQERWQGWRVVAALFIILAVASGLGFYGLSVYLDAFSEELGLSKGAVGGATAVMFFVSALGGLAVANFIGTHDARHAIVAGGLIGAVALAGLGRVSELWHIYAVYVMLGIGFAGAGLVPATTIVARWFTAKRSIALAVTSTGLSAGGIFVTSPAAVLIDRRGLDGSMPLLAIVWLVGVIPLALLVVRDDPSRVGQRPEGIDADAPVAVVEGVPTRVALRTRFFIWSTAAYLLIMIAQVGAISHSFSLVAERVDRGAAATALSLIAGSSIVFRLLGGWLATFVSVRGITITLCVVQTVGLAAISQLESETGLYIAMIIFGTSIGNLLMLQPLLITEAFGVVDYASIYARASVLMMVGVALGPVVLGVLRDSASYEVAYLVGAACSLVGAVVMATLAGPTRPQPAQALATQPTSDRATAR